MYQDDKIFISNNFSKEEYINLHLTHYSKDRVWEKAIDIFDDRIKGRFLNSIESILGLNEFTNAFSATAIMCLLIETLYQFHNGIDESKELISGRRYRGISKLAFRRFFTRSEYFKHSFNDRVAGVFYDDIRCGILHQAQTKNGSQLTTDSYLPLVSEVDNGIRVNIILFYESLLKEYQNYINRLFDPANYDLRLNFIVKMDFIANKSNRAKLA
ncbi:hypothetical protein [Paenibacillus sp. GM2]|uniref:hypothetical protein n=1 Tax=Paenibacillus sp. GM2 TaxID=1622070 RepID=UPI000839D372|nr:hypothetical protein [Paenibacillus sp. GM2]